MERKAIAAGLIVCIIVFIFCFYKCHHKPIEEKLYPIDSLLLENDSLRIQLDSIDTRIIDINEWYEKTYGIVLNQSTDSDIVFFERYLSAQRFNSCNIDTTVETSKSNISRTR